MSMQTEAEFLGVLVRSGNRRVLQQAEILLNEFLTRTCLSNDEDSDAVIAARMAFVAEINGEVGKFELGQKVVDLLSNRAPTTVTGGG